jgi:hypothetical protein
VRWGGNCVNPFGKQKNPAMTDRQWNDLLAVLRGELRQPPPVGFIIDCP